MTDMNGNAATLPVGVNAAASGSPLDNLTFHGNPQRTGWYQNETTLTTANVRPATFGKVAALAAPAGMPALGKVYAQPCTSRRKPPSMSGFGPASDAQDYNYFATGNGPFDGKSDFSQSIMKVPGN